ncbi:endoplasmic reticulum membrane sensor NFE2L1 [Nematolebias whitei]|uniref:endoplasmic reticulum membrane sensor NFE2L1 n=1 Tax=Nematolebias whitei TaxID=451745 RepID=UPI001899A7CF|nr:endoplasmic reticulum membrane sensor NFE2L1 [Nematolebias whitei]
MYGPFCWWWSQWKANPCKSFRLSLIELDGIEAQSPGTCLAPCRLRDVDGRSGVVACHTLDIELLQPPITPENSCNDLDLQDLLDILQPENTQVEMMTVFHNTMDLEASRTCQNVESDALPQLQKCLSCVVPQAHQPVPLLQYGLLHTPNPSELQPDLLPLVPSTELDDHSPTPTTRVTLGNSDPYSSNTPTNYTDLLTDDLEESVKGVNNLTHFSMNLLTQEDRLESENFSGFGIHFLSCDLPAPNIPLRNSLTQDLMVSPSSAFLQPEEDEKGLPRPVTDLLEDPNILEGIQLLDIALEEGFISEMADRLEEIVYNDGEIFQQETGSDQRPSSQKEDGEDAMDSDSGLSVDFIHSSGSSYISEGSTHYSSIFTPSTLSPSLVSTVENIFSEDEDRWDENDVIGTDLELQVTVKQEMLEEEIGAVGDAKQLFPDNYVNHKLLHGFNWLEYIGHDHTYNQTLSSPSRCKAPQQVKSALRHHKAKPYHKITETKNWNRDKRQAQALEIPFSNELIVHLPVEDFSDLLSSYQLTDEQLALARDIRRRGKNKIAAQNCRKRKLDVLLCLESEVSDLRHHFSHLLREKREALRHTQEMKHRLKALLKEIFSQLRDEEGRPLNATEHVLHFRPNDVTVASVTVNKNNKDK